MAILKVRNVSRKMDGVLERKAGVPRCLRTRTDKTGTIRAGCAGAS